MGITVNAVAPGFVDTEMTHSLNERQRDQITRRSPLHRLADVDDVANAVEFLLGDKARNITGTVLTVDAGQYRLTNDAAGSQPDLAGLDSVVKRRVDPHEGPFGPVIDVDGVRGDPRVIALAKKPLLVVFERRRHIDRVAHTHE